MALTDKDRKQLLILAIVLALGGGGAFWFLWREPKAVQTAQLRVRIDSLNARVDSAKADLARGSVEGLKQRVADYQASVALMRRLVPEGSEVPNLIDDVSSRAKRRGVNISQLTPLNVEEGAPFQIHRYRFSVVGRYDALGEFLSDVASLPRIMVPYDLTMQLANATTSKAFADTSGALVEVNFLLRTFVKPPASADSTGGGGTQ